MVSVGSNALHNYVVLLIFLAKSNIMHYFHELVICHDASLQKFVHYFCNALCNDITFEK